VEIAAESTKIKNNKNEYNNNNKDNSTEGSFTDFILIFLNHMQKNYSIY
jgi:hypothetical protein